MPSGKHGEVEHGATQLVRVDVNLKERYRLVCAEEGVTPSEDLRAYMASRVEGRYEHVGRFSQMLAAVATPTDQREPARAHRSGRRGAGGSQ